MKYNNTHIKSDNVGDMRHRVSIRTFTTTRNAAGEELRTWSELAAVWAAAEHKTGGSSEVEQAAQTTAKISVVFRIRYRTDINEKMVIVWNSKAWNIRSLLPDYDMTYLIIEAEDYYGNSYQDILAGDGLLVDDDGDTLIDDDGDTLTADL